MDTKVPNQLKCKYCSGIFSEQDQFCLNCGFPVRGSEEEQRKFISTKSYKQHELKELTKKTKNAQTTLFVLAGLFFVFGVIYYLINMDNDLAFTGLITNLILSAIFLALGGWAKKKPVASLISGLVLYVIVQLISMIDDPLNIVKGIIIKVIVIGYMVKGLMAAIEAEKIKKEHNIS